MPGGREREMCLSSGEYIHTAYTPHTHTHTHSARRESEKRERYVSCCLPWDRSERVSETEVWLRGGVWRLISGMTST